MTLMLEMTNEVIRINRRHWRCRTRRGYVGSSPWAWSTEMIPAAAAVVQAKQALTPAQTEELMDEFLRLHEVRCLLRNKHRTQPGVTARLIRRAFLAYTSQVARTSRAARRACDNPYPTGITMAAVFTATAKWEGIPEEYFLLARKYDCESRGHTP